MKIERAIEILDPAHRERYESIDPVSEACRMGMDALRRLIPCKPKYSRYVSGQGYFTAIASEKVCGHCKFAYTVVAPHSYYEYCPHCGQRQEFVEDDDHDK